jgi:hypothetical protein
MSGQPNKTQSEANQKRNEYMESLALQESINDMNLQANKTYLLSGQLPPQSQMQDTRTTSEKLKDVELMKQKIAGDFAGIIDSSAVFALINKISSSPLNLNNSLFKFFAQRASSIAEQYKKLYPIGIEGDQNDILRIYEYIKNMYSDTQGKFQSTKSYMNSQYSGSSSKVIGANDLDSVILQLEDVIKNIQFTTQKGVNVGGLPGSSGILRKLLTKLQELKVSIPDNIQMDQLMDEFNNPDIKIDVERRKAYEEYFLLIEKLPKYNEAIALINKINQYILSNNNDIATDGIKKLREMFAILFERKSEYIMKTFYENYKNRLDIKRVQEHRLREDQSINEIEHLQEEQERNAKAKRVYIVNPESDAVWVRNPGSLNDNANSNISFNPNEEQLEPPEPEQSETPRFIASESARKPEIKKPRRIVGDIERKSIRELSDENDIFTILSKYSTTNPSLARQKIIPLIERLNDEDFYKLYFGLYAYDDRKAIKDENYEDIRKLPKGTRVINLAKTIVRLYNKGYYSSDNNFDIAGFGLKKKRIGRPRGTGMPKQERIIIPNFVGFGINEINQKQLNNGIVKIRRNTKTSYNDMPSKRVSSNLQGILKTISGGGIPNYNDLGKLDEEEKNYLNKLISRSNLNDRISVPAPSKDQQEKDIHNFEVMKGQLMSGNDSQELVKKFKLLIRKLSKQGLLPKSDVDELSDVLLDLGY